MSRFETRYVKRNDHEQIVRQERNASYQRGLFVCAIYTVSVASVTMLGVLLGVWLSRL